MVASRKEKKEVTLACQEPKQSQRVWLSDSLAL